MIDTRVPLRLTFDETADAVYIYVVDEIAAGGVAETVDHDAWVNVDFGQDGRILGIEVLNAGVTLPIELLNLLRRPRSAEDPPSTS